MRKEGGKVLNSTLAVCKKPEFVFDYINICKISLSSYHGQDTESTHGWCCILTLRLSSFNQNEKKWKREWTGEKEWIRVICFWKEAKLDTINPCENAS